MGVLFLVGVFLVWVFLVGVFLMGLFLMGVIFIGVFLVGVVLVDFGVVFLVILAGVVVGLDGVRGFGFIMEGVVLCMFFSELFRCFIWVN